MLWVEGQTEEIVLPNLLQHFCPEISAGTAVLRVEHTGQFEKKGMPPGDVAKIYKRLAESSALVPPMVAILLDREQRMTSDSAKIERESNGTLRFLERTMFENYVLHAEAITVVLNELGEHVSMDAVQRELAAASGIDIQSAHGADILSRIFSRLSDSRTEFRKTRDTPSLVNWILANRPSELNGIGMFLRNLFALPDTRSTGATAVAL